MYLFSSLNFLLSENNWAARSVPYKIQASRKANHKALRRCAARRRFRNIISASRRHLSAQVRGRHCFRNSSFELNFRDLSLMGTSKGCADGDLRRQFFGFLSNFDVQATLETRDLPRRGGLNQPGSPHHVCEFRRAAFGATA